MKTGCPQAGVPKDRISPEIRVSLGSVLPGEGPSHLPTGHPLVCHKKRATWSLLRMKGVWRQKPGPLGLAEGRPTMGEGAVYLGGKGTEQR